MPKDPELLSQVGGKDGKRRCEFSQVRMCSGISGICSEAWTAGFARPALGHAWVTAWGGVTGLPEWHLLRVPVPVTHAAALALLRTWNFPSAPLALPEESRSGVTHAGPQSDCLWVPPRPPLPPREDLKSVTPGTPAFSPGKWEYS